MLIDVCTLAARLAGLKDFAANTLEDLESELASLKTRAVVAETQLEDMESYMKTTVRIAFS